jgi:hypothetical protein
LSSGGIEGWRLYPRFETNASPHLFVQACAWYTRFWPCDTDLQELAESFDFEKQGDWSRTEISDENNDDAESGT